MTVAIDARQKIERLAERQNGHATRAQLLGIGLSADAIKYLIGRQFLNPVHAGVYAIGYRRRRPPERAHAAVLACGAGAVLSHGSAAALYELRAWPAVPEVTAITHRRRPGIWVHRSRTLTAADATRQYGIPVTTAGRAIADIAGRCGDAELIQIVSDARRGGRLGPTALHRLLASSVRAARLIDPEHAPSESIFMATFLLFLKRHRLPPPLTEQPFHGFRVDAIYPAHRLIVELDGYEFHRDRAQFEADRARDAIALEHGFQTFRITWQRLRMQPGQLASQLRAILAARAPRIG